MPDPWPLPSSQLHFSPAPPQTRPATAALLARRQTSPLLAPLPSHHGAATKLPAAGSAPPLFPPSLCCLVGPPPCSFRAAHSCRPQHLPPPQASHHGARHGACGPASFSHCPDPLPPGLLPLLWTRPLPRLNPSLADAKGAMVMLSNALSNEFPRPWSSSCLCSHGDPLA